MTAKLPHVVIYTDGACSGNPGPGGWGALLVSGGVEREIFGGVAATTNNRMEMMAVIEALQALKRPATVCLHTDSQYVQKGVTEWMPVWKKRGWKTADKKPVKNADLWQIIDTLAAQYPIEWCWVRGHAGNIGNERADTLARRGVEQVQQRPIDDEATNCIRYGNDGPRGGTGA